MDKQSLQEQEYLMNEVLRYHEEARLTSAFGVESEESMTKVKPHELINQNSGDNEWYTPSWVIEIAREVMGHISLDPASCEEANKIVEADVYHSLENGHNGLNLPWHGKVWLNRPWGSPEFVDCNGTKRRQSELWIEKLIHEYEEGHVTQAMTIHFASTDTAWWHMLAPYPKLFFKGRVQYVNADPKKQSPTKGSVLTYLGNNVEEFIEVGSQYGDVMLPAVQFNWEIMI